MVSRKILAHVVPTRKSPTAVLRYVMRSSAEPQILGEIPGRITQDPAQDAISLMADTHPQCQGVKHVILSTDKFADREGSFAALRDIAPHFVAHFSGRRDHICALHHDTEHPHCHLVFPSIDGLRALLWKKRDLHKMQTLAWVPAVLIKQHNLEPAKANGIGRGSVHHELRQLAKTIVEQYPCDEIARAKADGLIRGKAAVGASDESHFETRRFCCRAALLVQQIAYVKEEAQLLRHNRFMSADITPQEMESLADGLASLEPMGPEIEAP